MRVEFAPSGVGLGHAGRCIPIARGLQKRDRSVKVFFSTYLDAVDYVRREGFLVVEVPSMDFKVKPDGSVDFRRTAMSPGPFVAPFNFLGQVGKEIEVMETFDPDVVVSDSRASPLVAAYMLGIPSICILNQFQVIIPRRTRYLRLAKFADAMSLTILGKIWTSSTKVLVPDFPSPHTICADNLYIPRAYRKKTRFVGPILPLTSKELPSKTELRRELALDASKPLIFAPISGPLKERSYLISVLRKILTKFPDDYQVVMSLGYPKSSAPPTQHGNLTVVRWIADRFRYLKACDFVVSRAGHGTVMQAICYGRPMILIPTPNHTEQRNNTRRAEELGVAMSIEQENLSRSTLLSAAAKLRKNVGFAERAEKLQKELSGFNGLETAIASTVEVADRGETRVSA
jgi:UDP-N-acetylglucosamine--N-acetylmuramyl-(pentapeptide) pyrophosphoryl-undecaprenol N-acetylglucosamine transferase